jgi:hypothetical protein
MTQPDIRRRVRWPEELVRLRGGSLRKQRARDRFLAALLLTGKVGLAAEAAGVAAATAYAERKRSESFARDWDAALLAHRQNKPAVGERLLEAIAPEPPRAAGESREAWA